MSTRLGWSAPAVLTLLVALLLLGGCAPPNLTSPTPVLATDRSVSPHISVNEPSEGVTMTGAPIRIIVGERVIEGQLSDSPAARALLARLPLTVEFSDYGGQEVLAKLPEPPPLDGMPTGDSAPAGTIGYYSPGQVLVLYYRDVGYFNGIVRLGQMTGDYSTLAAWSSPRTVTLEAARP